MITIYNILILLQLCFASNQVEIEFDINSDKFQKMNYSINENYLFYTFNHIDDCVLKVYKQDIISKDIDTFNLDFPILGKYNCSNYDFKFDDFIVRNDSLILKYRDYIFIYKYSKKNFNILDTIFIKDKINRSSIDPRIGYKIKLSENEIFGYLDLYLENERAINRPFVWNYNLTNGNIDTLLLNRPHGYKWAITQPRNIVDRCNNKILYCDIDRDSIYIYNCKINEISETIDLNIFNNDFFIDNQMNINNPKLFYQLNKDKMDSVYMIHSVNFLNEMNILVTYSVPKDKNDLSPYNLKYLLVFKNDKKWENIKINNPELLFGSNIIEDYSYYGVEYKILENKFINKYYYGLYGNELKNVIKIENVEDIINRIKNSLNE